MRRFFCLKKGKAAGLHGSGRNGGALHSGIYYPKESLKARMLAAGARVEVLDKMQLKAATSALLSDAVFPVSLQKLVRTVSLDQWRAL